MKSAYLVCSALMATLLLSINADADDTLTASWSIESSKVSSGEAPIRTACVMPAEGKLRKLSTKGWEDMTKESGAWSTDLQSVVESHLRLAGVSLVDASAPADGGAADDETGQVLPKVQEKYDGIAPAIDKDPDDIGRARFTLGGDVARLPCAARADVLVFVVGGGAVVTQAEQAITALLGPVAKSSKATLVVTMASAKTGEILAFVRLVGYEDFVKHPEDTFGEALDKQFKKLKIGTQKKKGH